MVLTLDEVVRGFGRYAGKEPMMVLEGIRTLAVAGHAARLTDTSSYRKMMGKVDMMWGYIYAFQGAHYACQSASLLDKWMKNQWVASVDIVELKVALSGVGQGALLGLCSFLAREKRVSRLGGALLLVAGEGLKVYHSHMKACRDVVFTTAVRHASFFISLAAFITTIGSILIDLIIISGKYGYMSRYRIHAQLTGVAILAAAGAVRQMWGGGLDGP